MTNEERMMKNKLDEHAQLVRNLTRSTFMSEREKERIRYRLTVLEADMLRLEIVMEGVEDVAVEVQRCKESGIEMVDYIAAVKRVVGEDNHLLDPWERAFTAAWIGKAA